VKKYFIINNNEFLACSRFVFKKFSHITIGYLLIDQFMKLYCIVVWYHLIIIISISLEYRSESALDYSWIRAFGRILQRISWKRTTHLFFRAFHSSRVKNYFSFKMMFCIPDSRMGSSRWETKVLEAAAEVANWWKSRHFRLLPQVCPLAWILPEVLVQ